VKLSEDVIVYLFTLGALLFVAASGLLFLAFAPEPPGKLEAMGWTAIVGGLLAALRVPRQRAGPHDQEPEQ